MFLKLNKTNYFIISSGKQEAEICREVFFRINSKTLSSRDKIKIVNQIRKHRKMYDHKRYL